MKISVIVPIYNVESYLRNCLDSIRSQTHRALEVILVDDGSPDGCAAICEEYAAADKRFKVIHKPNGGVASARNAGLDAATGEWIGFVDPDDYIEPDMYEYLLTHAVEHGADLSVCGLRIMVDGEQANPWITHYDGIRVLGREQAIEMYLDRNMHDGCVNKLYRRELWRGLRFPAYRIAEDLMAMWEIFQRTNITVRLSDDKYVYCRRTGSATTAKNAQTILDDFNAIKKRHDEVMARWPKFEELSARRCLLSAEGAWEWYFSSATEEQQRTVKPEMRKMARFCVPYWERYNGAGVGVYGRFKYRLARWYPSGWALALGKWTDKLYICLCGAKGKQTEVSAPPPPRAEPENHAVDSLLCVRQENLSAIHWNVSYTQSLRGYKRFLMGRRFKEQVLHGSWAEKQDFFRWSWSKLIHRDNGAKWLCVFDPLESVQSQLRRVDGLNDMIFQAVKRAGIEEDRNAVLKTGRQVFIFAGVHYCDIGGGQRSAQMARAFNDMGYRVYYIHYLVHPRYGEGKEEPLRDGSIFNPTLLHCQVDAFSVQDLDRLVSRGALFIFEVPVDKFEPYLEYAQAHHIPTVYEHIDNWDSELGGWFYREHIFRRYLQECTLVTVTARLLGEKVKTVSPQTEYLYLPNAVNTILFEPARYYKKPDDLVVGKKTLLYFGSLWGEWFDWDKLIYVARHCDCAINLIGGYDELEEQIKTLPRNIHFLGQKPQPELSAYLAHSDIALLPFKNCEIGRYVSPLKIFEYVAMNKPVLATPLDDIAGYPNVFTSEDEKEWARAVTEEWPEVVDTGVFTAQNSWYARCTAILERTGLLPVNPPAVSAIVSDLCCGDNIFRCVDSLLAFHTRYGGEIIVAVGSNGRYKALEERYGGQITLIKSDNPIFGRNLGGRMAHGEFLFFMDSTQRVVSKSYLDSALNILRREEFVGAVGRQGRWTLEGAPISDARSSHDRVESPAVLFRTDAAYLRGNGLLISKERFDDLGGFDEGYALPRFQDIDLSLRLKSQGYDVAYCPCLQLTQPVQLEETGGELPAAQDQNRLAAQWGEENPALLTNAI